MRHLMITAAALVVSALVMAKPHGVCDYTYKHAADDPVCKRLEQLMTRGCGVLSSMVAFVAQGQARGHVDACRALVLFVLLLCAATSTLVLYHIELASRVAFLVNKQVAPSTLLRRRREQLARDVKLLAPVSFYAFWLLLVLTSHRD